MSILKIFVICAGMTLSAFDFMAHTGRIWVLQNSDFFDSDSSKTEKKSKAVTSDRLFFSRNLPYTIL
jgi:hypothetical protein